MATMTYVDIAIERVRKVVRRIGKKPFADRVGVGDTLLRGAESPGWNPTASTLRSFEAAILPGEDGDAAASAHAEHTAANPRRAAKAVRA